MPLVAAFACPHTPQLLVRPETEDRDMVLRVHAAYGEVKQLLQAARPDVICVVAGDHVEGFFLTAVPALAVYVGSSVSGKFDRYRYTFDVHEPLARAVLEQGIERGFDLAYSQDLALDYAFFVPLHFTMPEPRVPIVPLYVNVYLPPQPTPARCYAWGQALRAILDARPERVALLASGGLSHFPGTDQYGSPPSAPSTATGSSRSAPTPISSSWPPCGSRWPVRPRPSSGSSRVKGPGARGGRNP